MRLGCFLFMLAIGLVVGGAQGLIVGLTNLRPTVVTIEEFSKARPGRGWYEMRGGQLDLTEAITESNRITGKITSAYVPVVPTSEEASDGKVHLLLLTKDESVLKTLTDFQKAAGAGGGLAGAVRRSKERREKKGQGDADQENVAGALTFLLQNCDTLILDRTVSGTIQFGIDAKSKDRRKLAAIDQDLAKDFAIMEDGKRPDLLFSVVCLVAGPGLSAFLAPRIARGGSAKAGDPSGTRTEGILAVSPDDAFGPPAAGSGATS